MPCKDCTDHPFVRDGHSTCRRHAVCNFKGYWHRSECESCCSLFRQALSDEEETSVLAKRMLKTWIRGFQKNHQGHYFEDEEIRELLFPRTSPRLSPKRTQFPIPQEIMVEEELVNLVDEPDLSQEEEDLLLSPSPAQPSNRERAPREQSPPEWLLHMRSDKNVPEWFLSAGERLNTQGDDRESASSRTYTLTSRNESMPDVSRRTPSVANQLTALTTAVNNTNYDPWFSCAGTYLDLQSTGIAVS